MSTRHVWIVEHASGERAVYEDGADARRSIVGDAVLAGPFAFVPRSADGSLAARVADLVDMFGAGHVRVELDRLRRESPTPVNTKVDVSPEWIASAGCPSPLDEVELPPVGRAADEACKAWKGCMIRDCNAAPEASWLMCSAHIEDFGLRCPRDQKCNLGPTCTKPHDTITSSRHREALLWVDTHCKGNRTPGVVDALAALLERVATETADIVGEGRDEHLSEMAALRIENERLRNLRNEVSDFLNAASWREIHCGYRALTCTVEPQHRDGLRAALSAAQSAVST